MNARKKQIGNARFQPESVITDVDVTRLIRVVKTVYPWHLLKSDGDSFFIPRISPKTGYQAARRYRERHKNNFRILVRKVSYDTGNDEIVPGALFIRQGIRPLKQIG